MSTKKKYRQYFELVKKLLTEKAAYRDSDTMLLNRIHNDELIALGYHPTSLPVYKYWQLVVKGALSDESTIERCRRKVQEEFAELRGAKWYARQGRQLDVIKAVQDL